ncbi:MAG: aquaporin [Planctomycetes bacterium]|nr:aquaporin [Planctomycetota bacterium]
MLRTMKRYFAEAIGTFMLVLAGCGAIAVNQLSDGAITHPGIALTFGLVVMAMIYALGDTSGAHLNPAVSIAFRVAGRLPTRDMLAYILAQCLGAIAAAALLKWLFPSSQTLGATLPAGSNAQSFVLELIITLMLMYVILAVATGAKEKGIMAGIAIGSTVALNALWAGPICGASMNPARSLAPALLSGHTESLWLYLLAPTLGSVAAVFLCRLTHAPGTCCTPDTACT